MKNTGSKKRDHLLEQGLKMISQIGLSGITLGNLAEQAGVSKSGLFAHFGSKEELQIALLQQSAILATEHVIAPALQEEEGLPRLKALIHHWFGWTQRAGLPGGCPVASAMFETDDMESPLREKVTEMELEWRTLLIQLTRQSVEKGHLHASLDIEQFVWELCGLYLSHHVSQRFIRDAQATDKAQKAIESLLARAGAAT